jgi:NADPH:quinone reductase-like Zn-dependent oxidoreductase
MTAHIGDYSFATAATASSSLGNAFSAMVHHCGLVAPTRDIEKKAEKVLIWGGGSSIGSFAIQIAAQGGYHVITTASIRHAKYLHSLGAAEVLDYYTLSRQELQTWLSANGPYFRIFTVAEDAVSQTIIGNVLWAQGGGEFITTNALREKTVLPRGVQARVVKLLDVYLKPEMREFAQWAYWSFIEKGLSGGTLKLGRTQLVEGGLRGLEEGLRTLQEGVSGVKLVVELWD